MSPTFSDEGCEFVPILFDQVSETSKLKLNVIAQWRYILNWNKLFDTTSINELFNDPGARFMKPKPEYCFFIKIVFKFIKHVGNLFQ